MYKFFVIAVIIAVAAAWPQQYGHPYSAQSILLHAGGGHQLQAPLYNSLGALTEHQNNAATRYQQYDQHQTDYYAHPQYGFEYKVQDPHTGDNKYQHETRDGDVVKGVYSLHEADGTIRIVEYSADKHSGFNAIVRREGHAQHIQPENRKYY